MASVEKRTRDGKITWLARWRDPDGKQRKKTFARKLDADRFVAAVQADMVRGHYIDPADRTTVAEYARRYAAVQPHSPRTARRVDAYIRNHLAETKLGKMRLQTVRTTDVQAWATAEARILADTTVRNVLSFVRSVFLAAVHDGLIAKSPAVKIRLPEPADVRVVPLEIDQVRTLVEYAPPRQAAIILTQAATGLRMGEVLGLRVQDVDFLRRTLTVDVQLDPDDPERGRTEPKTQRSRRTIPLPAVASEAIAAHLARWPAAEDGSIWTTRSGRVPRHDHYAKTIRAAVGRVNKAAARRRAGGETDAVTVPGDTSSHDLRHHYASVLIAAGEDVITVADRLGHKDASLVLRVYGHLMKNGEDRTRQAIDNAWGKVGSRASEDSRGRMKRKTGARS